MAAVASPAGGARPPAPALTVAALLLADGRFPGGAHAHSFGLEAAVAAGRVRDLDSLRAFIGGRLTTAGLSDAALVATTVRTLAERGPAGTPWQSLDAEADARIASPALRAASRRLGRQLARTARETWPHPALDALAAVLPDGGHQAVVFGAVAGAAGLDEHAAAVCVGYLTVSGLATAAVRLLGLDPFAVNGLVAGFAPEIDAVAAEALAAAGEPLGELPAPSAPLLDMAVERHARWETRLFAS